MLKLPDLSPYGVILKLVGIGAVVLAIGGFALSWSARGQAIASLTAWQNAVVISATDATVQPGKDGVRKPLSPAQVPAALAALKRSFDSCQNASAAASAQAQADKARADAADRALANAQVLFRNEYSSASKRIDALAATKTGATPELKCQAVGRDSKAAWEGWK